jgi:hypothetical protein
LVGCASGAVYFLSFGVLLGLLGRVFVGGWLFLPGLVVRFMVFFLLVVGFW